jgi:hypothetical protein
MTLIILTFVTISSILVSISVIYAIGKIKSIEEASNKLISTGKPGVSQAGPFHNLEGKPLWDMLSGKTLPDGVNQDDVENYREEYAPVLLKAIKLVFAEGQNDGKFGQPRAAPKNERQVKTLRMSINSWLPSQDISSLYNAGYDSCRADGNESSRLRMTLAEVAGSLFAKLQLPTPPGIVDSLIAPTAKSSDDSDVPMSVAEDRVDEK